MSQPGAWDLFPVCTSGSAVLGNWLPTITLFCTWAHQLLFVMFDSIFTVIRIDFLSSFSMYEYDARLLSLTSSYISIKLPINHSLVNTYLFTSIPPVFLQRRIQKSLLNYCVQPEFKPQDRFLWLSKSYCSRLSSDVEMLFPLLSSFSLLLSTIIVHQVVSLRQFVTEWRCLADMSNPRADFTSPISRNL